MKSCIAVLSVLISVSLPSSDGNHVTLTPGPEILVREGETLILYCNYTGTMNPDFINWYLNGDTLGLVIDAKTCTYITILKDYETERYSMSCTLTSFTLSIANISKDKDNGTKWECDIAIIGMEKRPIKASTRIRVTEAENFKDRGNGDTNSVPSQIGKITGGLVSIAVVATVLGYLIYRRRNRGIIDCQKCCTMCSSVVQDIAICMGREEHTAFNPESSNHLMQVEVISNGKGRDGDVNKPEQDAS